MTAPTSRSGDVVESWEPNSGADYEPLVVLAPLRRFLAGAGLDSPEDLDAAPIGDGHSNATFLLSTDLVLRRPPRGPLPPSAHDVLREARLLRALAGTRVRTPRVVAHCSDPAVIGAPFYLMERVPGDVLSHTIPSEINSPEQRRRISDELVDALVELHAVDYRELDLDNFGRPTGYLERQVSRFLKLWEYNRTRDLPLVGEIGRWLSTNMPTSRAATIVHGDYRLGNVVFAPESPAQLSAVLDWEMATVGDPLADVGYLLTHWHEPADPPGGFNIDPLTVAEGFPRRDEMIRQYEHRSGRLVDDVDWYVVLALWKACVFMEGNYKRALTGSSDDPFVRGFGERVQELAERALDVSRTGM